VLALEVAAEEGWVVGVDRAGDAVANAIGAEGFERTADGLGPGRLAGVGDRGDAAVAGDREGLGVRLGRVAVLGTAEAEADDAAVAVANGVLGDALGGVEVGQPSGDVGSEADFHANLLAHLRAALDPWLSLVTRSTWSTKLLR
jgi:hypothetical protein